MRIFAIGYDTERIDGEREQGKSAHLARRWNMEQRECISYQRLLILTLLRSHFYGGQGHSSAVKTSQYQQPLVSDSRRYADGFPEAHARREVGGAMPVALSFAICMVDP